MFGKEKNTSTNDQAQIEGLKSMNMLERRRAENAFFSRYSYFVRQGQFKHRLNEEEALTAYSDAIIQVTTHLKNGRFKGESSLKTYLFQIFNRTCVDLIRKKTTKKSSIYQTVWLDQLPIGASTRNVLSSIIGQEDLEQVKAKIRALGENCYRLLMAWGQGFSLKEVAKMLNLKDAQSAKSRKYFCLKKLREL